MAKISRLYSTNTSGQSMNERFQSALASMNPKPNLVIGVSGGMDSVALLELLCAAGKKAVVAHFNHQLRGAESDGDEAFVREEAARRGLEFRVGRGDVRAEAKGISIEMAARKLRHAFLAEAARGCDGDIVLAHHADDQIELVLMRARRGVEGYGAAGMREVSVSPSDANIRVLRPLLGFRKEELAAFVKARGFRFREDSSNTHIDIQRNLVRHKTIPALREMFGNDFESELLKHIQSMRANDDWWRQSARAWLSGNFAALPERMQKEVLIIQFEAMDLRVRASLLDAILRSGGKRVTVQPGTSVSLNPNGQLRPHSETRHEERLKIDLHSEERKSEFAGGKLEWSVNSIDKVALSRCDLMTFDAKEVGQFVTLRFPLEGDRVRLSGRSSTRSLMDVLARNKVPREKRSNVIVAENQHGQIFWVEGLRITEDFKVTEKTRTALGWSWTRERP